MRGMQYDKEKINGIKDVLRSSIESNVTLVLCSCQKLTVEVDAVIDNLLVASIGNKIIFIDIECICAVITCCEEVLEFLLNKEDDHHVKEEY